MKNFIGFLSLFALLTVTVYSCQPKAKKEVIVVPAQPTIIVKEPEKKSTTIILDKNGVKVEAKKVDVIIKKQ